MWSSIEWDLPSNVIFHQIWYSIECDFPSNVIFHRMWSSIESDLPPMVIFLQKLCSINVCPPWKMAGIFKQVKRWGLFPSKAHKAHTGVFAYLSDEPTQIFFTNSGWIVWEAGGFICSKIPNWNLSICSNDIGRAEKIYRVSKKAHKNSLTKQKSRHSRRWQRAYQA